MKTISTVHTYRFKVVRFTGALLLAMLAAGPGFAQALWPALGGDSPIDSMAESSDIRKRLWTALFEAPRDAAKKYEPSEERNAWGRWSVSVDSAKGAFYIIVSPQRNGSSPVYTQGTWIVKRSDQNGEFLQAKVFLRSDPGTFARIYPAGSRSRIDIIAYGGVIYREVMIPLSFEDVLRSPFSKIRSLTKEVIDWDIFAPDPALFGDVRNLASAVRSWLPSLHYADDGAIDADGTSVYISTLKRQASPAGLNCSGFVKWLVDGMLFPISGSYLSVDVLRQRMTSWRGSSFTIGYEESLDPFFGLDWSRALARAAWSAFYPSRVDSSPLANDVDEAPFAMRVSDADPVNGGSMYEAYSDNFGDAGLDVRGLKAALFLLASREPNRFYLAQFNARDKDPPNLRRYFHIAALFPYFDKNGVFKVDVFESAAETSLEAVLSRGYEFVKLIRMPSAARFEPQVLVSE